MILLYLYRYIGLHGKIKLRIFIVYIEIICIVNYGLYGELGSILSDVERIVEKIGGWF